MCCRFAFYVSGGVIKIINSHIWNLIDFKLDKNNGKKQLFINAIEKELNALKFLNKSPKYPDNFNIILLLSI